MPIRPAASCPPSRSSCRPPQRSPKRWRASASRTYRPPWPRRCLSPLRRSRRPRDATSAWPATSACCARCRPSRLVAAWTNIPSRSRSTRRIASWRHAWRPTMRWRFPWSTRPGGSSAPSRSTTFSTTSCRTIGAEGDGMRRHDELSTPRGLRSRPFYDPEAFGRFSEAIARFLGTARYLAVQTVLVLMWIAFNVVALRYRFDPYPFILLNLLFSTQAAYAAPLILLAKNRQADRDRAEVDRDREANARARVDMDYLAREIAAIRIALQSKADRDDVAEVMTRLDEVLVRLPQAGRVPLERE